MRLVDFESTVMQLLWFEDNSDEIVTPDCHHQCDKECKFFITPHSAIAKIYLRQSKV